MCVYMCARVLMYVIIIFILVYVQHGEVLITSFYACFYLCWSLPRVFEIMHSSPLTKYFDEGKISRKKIFFFEVLVEQIKPHKIVFAITSEFIPVF